MESLFVAQRTWIRTSIQLLLHHISFLLQFLGSLVGVLVELFILVRVILGVQLGLQIRIFTRIELVLLVGSLLVILRLLIWGLLVEGLRALIVPLQKVPVLLLQKL